MLQNQTLWEITFKRLHDSTNEIHNNLKILRFSDSVCMQNCLFMNQIEQNEKNAKSFSKLKNTVVITTITKPDQLPGNFLTPHVLAQTSMVHNQPNIIVSLTRTILKNNSH